MMPNWTVWDWIGRIGMYLVIAAVVHFAGWYGVAIIGGILMVVLALVKLSEREQKK